MDAPRANSCQSGGHARSLSSTGQYAGAPRFRPDPRPVPSAQRRHAKAGSTRASAAAACCRRIAFTRPGRADITTIRSAKISASSMLWVMNTTVLRLLSWMRSSSSCISWRVMASSAANGSSISSTSGSAARMRAKSHALLHAARQLGRVVAFEAGELHQLDEARRTAAAFGARHALHAQAELDVALHRLPRKQRIGLEHHTATWLDAGDRLAVQQHAALGGLDEAGEHVQHRGLAAAGGAEQADRSRRPRRQAKSRAPPRRPGRDRPRTISSRAPRSGSAASGAAMPFPGKQQALDPVGDHVGDQHGDRDRHHADQHEGQITPVLALPDQRAEAGLCRDEFR